MGVSTTALVWACVAKLKKQFRHRKLEPQGTVNEVQVPIGGVVKAIYVNDGQQVRRGERLLSLDPAAKAQLASLQKIRTVLSQSILSDPNEQVTFQSSTRTSNGAAGLPLELVS